MKKDYGYYLELILNDPDPLFEVNTDTLEAVASLLNAELNERNLGYYDLDLEEDYE